MTRISATTAAIALLAAGTALAPMAQAQSGSPSAASSSGAPSPQEFVTEAASGNLAEVALGQMAEQNAQSPAVKLFGRWMATDHTLAEQQLQAAAQQQNLTVPGTPDQQDQQMASQMQALHGAQFDQQYIQHMVQDHQKDLALYQQEASGGSNPAIKAYAAQLVPVLQQHLAGAQQVQASLGQSGASSSSSGQ